MMSRNPGKSTAFWPNLVNVGKHANPPANCRQFGLERFPLLTKEDNT